MKDQRIVFRDLVHDIIDHDVANDLSEAVETGCGFIVAAWPSRVTDAPTSCLRCLSGEFVVQREVEALGTLMNTRSFGKKGAR